MNPDNPTEQGQGWLDRQFANVRRDVATWPAWMRREAGIDVTEQGQEAEGQGWRVYMSSPAWWGIRRPAELGGEYIPAAFDNRDTAQDHADYLNGLEQDKKSLQSQLEERTRERAAFALALEEVVESKAEIEAQLEAGLAALREILRYPADSATSGVMRQIAERALSANQEATREA